MVLLGHGGGGRPCALGAVFELRVQEDVHRRRREHEAGVGTGEESPCRVGVPL